MMILRFLFYAFLLYLAFRLVFDFILPVYRTTKRVKKGFREMQERMNQHTQPYQDNFGTVSDDSHNKSNKDRKGSAGEYIDFEEIKD